jgi:hypothetical protein
MSIDKIPEDVSSWISEFVKILSIKVADVGVIRVGLMIVGIRECAKLILIKSLVG